MKTILFVAVLAVLLCGCDSLYSQRVTRLKIEARQQYVEGHAAELSPAVAKAIGGGFVLMGMTKEQVIASWGRPRDINRTVTARTVREQWVYGTFPGSTRYLYFTNGRITSWQD